MESILSSKAEDLDCQCWPSSLEFLKTCVCRIILPSKQKQENFVIKNSNQLQAKHCVLTFCKFRKFWPTRYQPDWSVTESIIFFELISVQENAGPEGAHKRQQTVMNDNRVCRKIPILSQLMTLESHTSLTGPAEEFSHHKRLNNPACAQDHTYITRPCKHSVRLKELPSKHLFNFWYIKFWSK